MVLPQRPGKAVSMEPDNMLYLRALRSIENGGEAYREHAGGYRGFSMRGSPCSNLLLCWFAQLFCCGGYGCC